MIGRYLALATTCLIATANATIYFQEKFDEGWEDRWTIPTKWRSESEMGEWEHTAGKHHGPDADDKGIMTKDSMRFYGLSAPFTTPFVNKDKKLILQYTIKYEKPQECGGAYIKMLPGGDKFDADSFSGDTPYNVMFGPDVCGTTKRTHVILHSEAEDSKGENVMTTPDIPCQVDTASHQYRLVLHPDNRFDVFVDNRGVRNGRLEDFFPFLKEPRTIPDPDASKPEDWVDEMYMDDPESVKPEGYDDLPHEIPDPDASKPADWVDDEDGEWEPPMIDNPDYHGPWYPEQIRNPDYKGQWEHPMIDNPAFVPNDSLYNVCTEENPCTHVGFELWQVTAGTLFDDIIITDDEFEAMDFATETFYSRRDHEKEMQKESEALQEEKQNQAMADKFKQQMVDSGAAEKIMAEAKARQEAAEAAEAAGEAHEEL